VTYFRINLLYVSFEDNNQLYGFWAAQQLDVKDVKVWRGKQFYVTMTLQNLALLKNDHGKILWTGTVHLPATF